MKTKIKYGVVGSGLMGCEHISNINLIDSAEVVAISDSNENSINKAKNLIVWRYSYMKAIVYSPNYLPIQYINSLQPYS